MNGARFYIRSLKTGRLYLVEALNGNPARFGDSLDNQCRGSIKEKDSIISESTHGNVGYARNPMDYVASLEK